MAWKVRFFQTSRLESPVENFIKEQDKTTHAKILHAILLLKNNGPLLKPPYIKKLQNNLYELRISGNIAVRIFYTKKDGEYHLIHAFKKKSQQTPLKEIRTALDRMKKII